MDCFCGENTDRSSDRRREEKREVYNAASICLLHAGRASKSKRKGGDEREGEGDRKRRFVLRSLLLT